MFDYNISKSTKPDKLTSLLFWILIMQQITLCNVHQNNLKIPKLTIPLNEVVVFCGPSGSGKSSLAIDTILAEGQRRCVEALRSSIRINEKRLPRPMVESIEGLPPTFGMRQDLGARFDKHATLADLLGIQELLEHIFLEQGQLHCPKTRTSMAAYSPTEATNQLLAHYNGLACHVVSTIQATNDNYLSIIDELIRNGHTRSCAPDSALSGSGSSDDALDPD